MRIVVIGISGAGKTSLARQLAQEMQVPHIELDALYWEPGWTAAAPAAFTARAESASAGPAWVADGNYRVVRPLLWARATHLVWLDYPRPLIMARVIRRSVARLLGRRELWNGNRERWRNLLEPGHPIRWAWTQWRPWRQGVEVALAGGAYPHLAVLRLRHPRELPAARATLVRRAGRTALPPRLVEER
ncbi:AAA family ATPase [Roseomonas marmotae]|uniref:AAA family ATPase n=1 Tax=Roseomonas marmotae TaxID=2768161 RepID=A0ABS3KCI1_9PROT|nr:AAA family ATPase [Roseomonas marmotae]MBO1075179.1 AAA family ATPase [Roseomonas marmotae]QTI79712.1 AAA family ATPase [Roseomonas marmotae]